MSTLPTLYRHTKRDVWGLGLMIRRLDDRAHMQFQDGRLRTIHLDYASLLEAVDRPYDVARGLVDALESMAPDEMRPKVRRGQAPVSMSEQVAYFRELFAEGFAAKAYTDKHRGDGRKRPLKRHRDALLARAQKELSAKAIAEHRRKGGASAVHDVAAKIANMTGLVAAKERKAFAKVDETHHEQIATTLRALLHGSAPLANRFDAWVRSLEAALGQPPSWPLATLFMGALEPTRHVVVTPRLFELQARFMAPGLHAGDRPMGLLYMRLREMVENVRERLLNEGLAPRDFLDVCDFMRLTLKPAGRKRIAEMRKRLLPQSTSDEERLAA